MPGRGRRIMLIRFVGKARRGKSGWSERRDPSPSRDPRLAHCDWCLRRRVCSLACRCQLSRFGVSTGFSNTMNTHIEPQKTWKERWMQISDGEGGGQSDVKFVRSKQGGGSQVCFLKILRNQNDPIRRNRFYREISAYRTLNHPGILRLIDTNAEEFEDLDFKLYLVTDFVEGMSLQKLVENQGAQPFEASLNIVIRLLEIIEHCHQNETVHRDIKPDNVMIRCGPKVEPVLVDFGLSFNREIADENTTQSAEELGNRFLRLPEFSPSSPNKRNPISDVTLCAGILIFVLTAKRPVFLLNENRQMPHQRNDVRENLVRNVPHEHLNALLGVFDRSFQLELPQRWHSATELQNALNLLLKPSLIRETIDNALWARINSYMNQPHVSALTDLNNMLGKCIEAVRNIASKLHDRLKSQFFLSQTGMINSSAEGFIQTQYAFRKAGHPDEKPEWITFNAKAVGDEILLTATVRLLTQTLHRTTLRSPDYGSTFEKAVEEIFLKEIARLIP